MTMRANATVAIPYGLSLYLDLVRFVAALVVFAGHAAGKTFTGGLFWQTGLYLQTAVMVFFVLSGYVIAYVMEERENNFWSYSKARITRLYSVVLPALILTALCDTIGIHYSPGLYYSGPWPYPHGNQVAYYVASLLFVNQFSVTGGGLEPGINGPFWSLSYEVFYYSFIAFVVFLHGWKRVIAITLGCLLAGPTILALLPIWLFGYVIFRLRHALSLAPAIGAVLAATGLCMLLASPFLREETEFFKIAYISRNSIAGDYYDAFAFGLHIIGSLSISNAFAATFSPMRRFIRWLGTLTFALYLMHRPIIQLLAALPIAAPTSWAQQLYVYLVTILTVALLALLCERFRTVLTKFFNRTWNKDDLGNSGSKLSVRFASQSKTGDPT